MGLKSLLSTALGNRPPRGAPRQAAAASRGADALREEILDHGLDADRALALADALEGEGRQLDALDWLVLANRLRRDGRVERRLVRLRRAALSELDHTLAPTTWPHYAVDEGPVATGPLEVPAAAFTPGVLRTGILQHGHLLVRGLVPPARVARLRAGIDRAFAAQEAAGAGDQTPDTLAWCDPLEGLADGDEHRLMVRASHGVLATDSPRALFEFLETVRDLRLDDFFAAYLGERPGLAVRKCTLRRADASDWRIRLSNWHQDGAFLGEGIRAVNAWFALSRCGRDAPGMELMPLRLENRLLPRGEGDTQFSWTVAPETIERELPGVPIWRPEFEAGDVLFFDHWSLHRTAAFEGMPNLRYAIESWFFAPSTYVDDPSTLIVV